MFDPIGNEKLSENETKVLNFWESEKIFEKSIENRKDQTFFSFYDGPPFATGLPHYGNLLASILKDVIPRYKTMKGYYVPRRFGWDCHGLPIENEIEKTHDIAGVYAIEKFGIPKFNEACRDIVLRYSHQWKAIIKRIGRWVSFDPTYRTMDITFMESVWWVFKELYEKGLIYEGYKVMPFSAKLGTPLSNFEAGLNYQEVDDPAITIALELDEEKDTYILVWTTTPWTLISNLAATVGENIDYLKLLDKKSKKKYILAKTRISTYFKDQEEYEVLQAFKGAELKGKTYKPLFNYFSLHKKHGAFRIISGDFVSTDDGTGIVHTAPGFGEEDFYACKEVGIDPVCPVDQNGCFTEEIEEYKGLFVKDADKDIIKRIKGMGLLVHHGTCRHRYPYCWRTDSPLIYRVMTSWFVNVEKVKDKMLKANQKIYWMPSHIKNHRFGRWLEGARDWAISRNRYWGTPLPLWRSEEGDLIAIGSVKELEEYTGKKIDDIHRHFIDDLKFEKDGKHYKRVEEVFDCWFESGSMPYAQNHYPFEDKESFLNHFPADFIAEGIDQTRGWFYTLTVLAAALFDSPAFKNVIVNGIILAEDGNKMSKRLKNYPEPKVVLEKYGADAVRLYLLHSPVVKGDDMRFTEKGVELVMRQILLPLWNSYSFFITYARIYNWDPKKSFQGPEEVIDRWILSKLNKLNQDVERGMDAYDLNKSVDPFVEFIEELTNWYIRRSRRRFWQDDPTPDRHQAFSTLYTVLIEFSKIVAPFIPFISESIYQNLSNKECNPASVHLCDYPKYNERLRDLDLEKSMALLQTCVSLGHSLRKDKKVKVRQPLPYAHISVGSSKVMNFFKEQSHLIKDELNVKEVQFHEDEEKFVKLFAKPNFRVLGKKVGKLMPKIKKIIDELQKEQLEEALNGETIEIICEGDAIDLTNEDIEVSRKVKEGLAALNIGEVTVALDLALTEDLIHEGNAREIVNKIQTMRREASLEKTDRIKVKIETTQSIVSSFKKHQDYIQKEVLATEIEFLSNVEGSIWDINGEPATIGILKN